MSAKVIGTAAMAEFAVAVALLHAKAEQEMVPVALAVKRATTKPVPVNCSGEKPGDIGHGFPDK